MMCLIELAHVLQHDISPVIPAVFMFMGVSPTCQPELLPTDPKTKFYHGETGPKLMLMIDFV